MRRSDVITFARVRNLSGTAILTVAGWGFLIVAPDASISTPLQELPVPTTLVWPGIAAIATQVASWSQLWEWEARSAKRVVWGQSIWTAMVGLVNIAVGAAIAPVGSAVPMIKWYLCLAGFGLIVIPFFKDNAWLLLAGLFLVATYDLGLYDSIVRRALEDHARIFGGCSVAVYSLGHAFLFWHYHRSRSAHVVRRSWAAHSGEEGRDDLVAQGWPR